MKSSVIKTIVSSLIGAGAGSAITYGILKKKEAETLRMYEAEIEDLYASIDELLEEINNQEGAKSIDISDEEEEYIEKDVEVVKEIAQKARRKEDYNKIAAKYKKDDTKEVEEEKDEWVDKIYFINEDEFGEDPMEAHCASFYSDGTLVEDISGEIIDAEKIKHLELNQQFDKLDSDGPELIWIRDVDEGVDYEIARDSRTYDQAMNEKE